MSTPRDVPSSRAAEQFRLLSRELACIWDTAGVLLWASPAWEGVVGLPAGTLPGRHYLDFVHPDDAARTAAGFGQAHRGGPHLDRLENRVRSAGGADRWMLWSCSTQSDSGLLYAVARDVTDRKLAELRLAESQAQYRLLTENSTDAITVVSRDGEFDYVSPAGRNVFGWDPEQLIGRKLFEFIHPADAEGLRATLAGIPSDQTMIRLTARFRGADGSYRWLESTGRQIRDRHSQELLAVIGSTRDVTDRRTAQDLLRRQAQTDPLTGAANRAVLTERLLVALGSLDRAPGAVAVLLLDLDRFKAVNDSLGHHVGDEILVATAKRLLAACRPTDTVARYGGDEFVVLAEGLRGPEDAGELAQRLLAALREPYHVGALRHGDEDALLVTGSIGVTVTTRSDHTVDDLLREADLALYRAKNDGRDRHELFDEELQARALRRMGTRRAMRRVLTGHPLQVRYQPVVRLVDRRVVGAEGTPWILDDSGRELSRADFLDVAHESGLILELERRVLERVVADQATFNEFDAEASVSVNLSVRGMSDIRFVEQVAGSLSTAGLPGRALLVGLTERALHDRPVAALPGVRRLRDAGIRVGLDDFGTGQASLSALYTLPLDFLKVDGGLVAQAAGGGRQASVLRAIVTLGHSLDFGVVAEGVDTPEQLRALRELGCRHGQGALFGPPLTAADYAALLRAQGDGAVRVPRQEPPVGTTPRESARVSRVAD